MPCRSTTLAAKAETLFNRRYSESLPNTWTLTSYNGARRGEISRGDVRPPRPLHRGEVRVSVYRPRASRSLPWPTYSLPYLAYVIINLLITPFVAPCRSLPESRSGTPRHLIAAITKTLITTAVKRLLISCKQ
ncbi:hypothetical protein J6590_001267 [Homalodisca vitripennis]|nr:hypothetical protein J6590_001267 [Homalodisca vitripennis]